MKFITILVLLLLIISTSAFAQEIEGMMERQTLTHDDIERDYLVYTPANYDENQEHILLLILHPASTTAQQMVDMTRFESLADANGVVMVFPNSVGGRWNSTGTLTPDDVGFISALLDKIIADYHIDEAQIFALGYSSGGLMTMRLRCALSDRLNGIISYAAPMTFRIANDCVSAETVSAMVIHGTVDEVFPYSGQAVVNNGEISGTFSAEQTVSFLASLNTCNSQAETQDVSATNSRNRTFLKSYPCTNTVTELYTVAGLSHFGWAGSLSLQLGDETLTLNQTIFRFIKAVGEQ